MFLESSYQPLTAKSIESITIYDVAVLAAQIGDRPFLKKGSTEHLTSGMIQLACYFSQGWHIARTGRSLFKDDFYIIDNRIESPKITKLFGPCEKRVTPFTMTEAIKPLLASVNNGFSPESNFLCQQVIFETVTQNYKDLSRELKETKPYQEAMADPFKRINKSNIKEYFESKLLKPTTEFTEIIIGE